MIIYNVVIAVVDFKNVPNADIANKYLLAVIVKLDILSIMEKFLFNIIVIMIYINAVNAQYNVKLV